MYNLIIEKKKNAQNDCSFIEYSFEINNTNDFLEISDYLFTNKIGKNDFIKILIKGQEPHDYIHKISSIINSPYAFCNFIKYCRKGINGFPNDGTYQYPKDHSFNNMAKQIGDYLTINTRINICFERIPNNYDIDLSKVETIRELVGKIEYSFISNSVSCDDTVTLKINDNKLNYLVQVVYYTAIVQAVNHVRNSYQLPIISTKLPEFNFEEIDIDKCNLPFLLKKQTGINFVLASANSA